MDQPVPIWVRHRMAHNKKQHTTLSENIVSGLMMYDERKRRKRDVYREVFIWT